MTQQKKNSGRRKTTGKPGGNRFNFYWVYAILFGGFLIFNLLYSGNSAREISFLEFKNKYLVSGDVSYLEATKSGDLFLVQVYIKKDSVAAKQEKYKEFTQDQSFFKPTTGPFFYFSEASAENLETKLEKAQEGFTEGQKVSVKYRNSSNWFRDALSWILPIAIMIALWMFIMRRMGGAGGGAGGAGGIFSIGKSKATLFDKDTKVSITFNDVAGLEEAKMEVMEVVDFLKNPKKFTALGGKIPKGVLLVGSPGTGKTLLAKAVAGEAKVPFFSLSGSDFVEMFVGVGASRVRDLFRQAREKAPCIIFIDEIDAIGRSRGKGQIVGGNDERENTLNALLVEMDGFSTDSGVIIMAATNRPDVLDSALLRPGRFDRQIAIDRPDLAGREAIFKVHLSTLKLSSEVDVHKLAAQTPGFAGAEIANVCNEAALIAARKDKKHIEMEDFQDAIDRVIGGLEKKNKIISPEEKQIVAYHEAGHAVVGWFLEHAEPLVKVSIVPRGVAALGYAQYLPKEQYLYTTEQLLDRMCMALGGRVAEDLIFGKISTGAQNDLERITKMAYGMVTIYGMNHRIGNLSYRDSDQEMSWNKPYSEKTAEMIDEEVRGLVSEMYVRTKDLLLQKKNELERLAMELLDKEILFKTDLERLIGQRPFEEKHALELEDKSGPLKKSVKKSGKSQVEKPAAKSKAGQNGRAGTKSTSTRKKKV